MALDSNTIKTKANGVLSGFSAGQRVVVVVAVITLAAGGALFAQWAAKPTMVPLFSNLEATDASEITAQLQSSGVPYELADNGRSILVPQAKVYQTRLDLAGEGLPAGGSQGYKLLDKQGITTSEFREHVDYQRALEGELSKTISSISGVEAATVHLVIPKQDVFSSDTSKPTASVLIKTAPGKGMSNGSAQAVVNLVASSVEGLSPEDVTVADATGRILAGAGQNGAAGNEDTQRQATQGLEDTLNAKINSMLLPLVGEGKAVVQARAELNWDKNAQTSEVFNPNNKPVTPLSQRSTSEQYAGNGTTATGCLGTGTPQNGVCETPAGAGGSGSYTKADSAQDNGVDRIVTQTEKTPGSINRVSVAVLVDSNVANLDTAEIEKLVTDAAGLQVARGDTVTVSRMAFDTSQAEQTKKALEEAAKAKQSEATMNLIKTAATFAIIVIVLAILFLTTRRKAAKFVATPVSMAEIGAAMPALPSVADTPDALEAAGPAVDNTPEALERAKVDREITDLIERQPEEVASLLRTWLADRRG